MNCTLRVSTSRGSLIVKQSRPWVEKYPQFAAPEDRALREIEFYRQIGAFPSLAGRMPRLLAGDPDAFLLVLEDLGNLGDYGSLYRGETLSPEDLDVLASFLGELHSAHRLGREPSPLPNREMRALNHAHIFELPFASGNGPDLDRHCPGLFEASRAFLLDGSLRTACADLGRRFYLSDGHSLLHGDFFPGSIVRSDRGPMVIDPEFGFFGHPEFDVGVFLAHLVLARQPHHLHRRWLVSFGADRGYQADAVLRLAGVEILRRLLGYAQLPLTAGLEDRVRMLELGRRLVLEPDTNLLDQP